MKKADARRSTLADQIADHLIAEGLNETGLRALSKAAGLSDRMLVYYFKTKNQAIEAGLHRAAERMTEILTRRMSPQPLPPDELLVNIKRVVLEDALSPYMALWLEVVARAARDQTPYKHTASLVAAGFLDWTSAQLDAPGEHKRDVALAILAQVEGLVLLKAAGLPLNQQPG